MPFTGRINDVSVERGQYAAPGIQLAGADGIDVAEVAAQVPLDRLRPLVTGLLGGGSVEPDRGLPQLDQLGLEAVVRLRTSTLSAEWPARFSRMGDSVDPKTRAIEVIVMVDKPYEKAVPGIRPPLTKGMFVEVELRAPPGRPYPSSHARPCSPETMSTSPDRTTGWRSARSRWGSQAGLPR